MGYPVIDPEMTGNNIRKILREKRVTVAKATEYLGISGSSIYKALRGDTVLSLDNMYALSEYLGVSVNEMIVSIVR